MNTKEVYIEKLQARLNQMDSQIETLKADAANAKADMKIELENQIDELKEAQAEAQGKVDEIRDASDDAWTDLKIGAESAWDDFEYATKKAMQRFAA